MTYDQAAKFAGLASFRHILAQDDGSYAVVVTWLAWVSAALMAERRVCTTATQVIAIDSGNAQMFKTFELSRHSIKRRAAREGREALARHKTRSAAKARQDASVIVPGVSLENPIES